MSSAADEHSRDGEKVALAYPHPADPFPYVSARFDHAKLLVYHYDALGLVLPDGRRIGGRRRIAEGGAIFGVPVQTGVAQARNRIVREFLRLDAEWLLQLDTDMTFEADLVDRLVDAADPVERPIVGALCFGLSANNRRKFWPMIFVFDGGRDQLRQLAQYPEDALVQVNGTGAACLLVHRRVLETMAKRYPGPRPWFAETPFCERDEAGEPVPDTWAEMSEDLTFCLRAQACGFPVFVHTGIKLGHLKEFEADEGAFLGEAAGLADSAAPRLPTFAVIPSRARPGMLATLRAQLEGQCQAIFVFDNGYPTPPPNAIGAHGWGLHRMWNAGLELAELAANGNAHNVLVINDDVTVAPDFCGRLEEALRFAPDILAACPGIKGAPSMTGWAFMLRGEAGLRLDERFTWWYGDSDLERQIYERGGRVVAVDSAGCKHLDPSRSTFEDPERLAQAEADEAAFADKWGVDPEALFLARRRAKEALCPS